MHQSTYLSIYLSIYIYIYIYIYTDVCIDKCICLIVPPQASEGKLRQEAATGANTPPPNIIKMAPDIRILLLL